MKETTKQALFLLLKIGIAAAAIFVVFTFFLGVTIYHKNNMAPAMRDGDLAITYRRGSIFADTVVWYDTQNDRQFGRIVGMEGDVIDIDKDGKYLINGSVPLELIYYNTASDKDSIDFPYTVPEGSYFVLNDMRDDTKDSRTYGAIKKEDIKGTLAFLFRRRSF